MARERRDEEAKKMEWNDGDATLHSMPASRILPLSRSLGGFPHCTVDHIAKF